MLIVLIRSNSMRTIESNSISIFFKLHSASARGTNGITLRKSAPVCGSFSSARCPAYFIFLLFLQAHHLLPIQHRLRISVCAPCCCLKKNACCRIFFFFFIIRSSSFLFICFFFFIIGNIVVPTANVRSLSLIIPFHMSFGYIFLCVGWYLWFQFATINHRPIWLYILWMMYIPHTCAYSYTYMA